MRDSFRFPQGFRVEQQNHGILLPKSGWVRYRNSREILGIVKNITTSRKCGKLYVSIQTEREVETSRHSSSSIIGIDVGIAQFATLSSGQVFEGFSNFKKTITISALPAFLTPKS